MLKKMELLIIYVKIQTYFDTSIQLQDHANNSMLYW